MKSLAVPTLPVTAQTQEREKKLFGSFSSLITVLLIICSLHIIIVYISNSSWNCMGRKTVLFRFALLPLPYKPLSLQHIIILIASKLKLYTTSEHTEKKRNKDLLS